MKRVVWVCAGMALGAFSAVAGVAVEGGRLVVRENGQTLTIQGWGPDGLRVTAAPDAAPVAKGAYQLPPAGEVHEWALSLPQTNCAAATADGNVGEIRNGRIKASVAHTSVQRGLVSFHRLVDGAWQPILREYDYKVIAHAPPVRSFKATPLGLWRCEQHFEPPAGERLFGMGENDLDSLDLKGHVIDLYQRHVKAVIPFVVSSKGYGFLWNNPSLGRVEFGRDRTRWSSEGCRRIDYYVTAGDTYADLLRNYTEVVGRAPAFPYWASGFWMCKLRYKSQSEFLRTARAFRQWGLPLDVHVIDYYHWKYMGDWKVDPVYWPDPAAMCAELNAMGTRVAISPWTLLQEEGENYAAMNAGGLFTETLTDSAKWIHFDNKRLRQYDPTHPDAAALLQAKWRQNYLDKGIRSFWLDPCDEFHEIADYDQVLYHIGPAVEAHAWFPIAHQRNVYEGMAAAGVTDVVNICRNAWAGSQRWGACPAPHDIASTFDHLRRYLKVGLNVMMAGVPWWNCDVGGFCTWMCPSGEFPELMARWYQWGAFMPVFRTHGARANNEPWTIGAEVYPALRAMMLLRERLRPYVMEQMAAASASGLPPMRPIFFDYPADEHAYALEDEFLFGAQLLVAPVTTFGARERDVYLPAGAQWLDAWSGTAYEGGQTVRMPAPIEHAPVFVRADRPALLEKFRGLFDEDLFELERAHVVSVDRGRVAPQDMLAFGSLWGNNSQMVWWGGLNTGDRLVLEFPVKRTTKGAPKLYVTKAFDYGVFSFKIDEGPETEPIDFYANLRDQQLDVPTEVTLPQMELTAGSHRLTVTCRGRNPAASNTLVGLDRILLPAATSTAAPVGTVISFARARPSP